MLDRLWRMIVALGFSLIIPLTIGASRVCFADTSPAGYWKFDEDKGKVAKDSSPNANDGEIIGGTWIKDDKVSALQFNGIDNHVVSATHGLPTGNKPRTMSVWVKTNGGNAIIIGYGKPDQSQYSGLYLGGDGVFVMGFWSNDCASGIVVNDGRWHHLIGTFDGETVKTYVDGKAGNTRQTTAETVVGTSLYIGQSGNSGAWFKGLINEVAIYDRALTEDEIKAYYDKTKDNYPKEKLQKVSSLSPPEICDFEAEGDIARWVMGNGAVITRSTEYVSHGGYSAKVIFQPAKIKKEQTIALPRKSLKSEDWSPYGMFVMDVYNPNNFKVIFGISIESGKGSLYWHPRLTIPPSQWKPLQVCLLLPTNYVCAEEYWGIDDINSITVWPSYEVVTEPPVYEKEQMPEDKEVALYLDNVRLLSKEETVKLINTWAPIESPPAVVSTKTSPEVNKIDENVLGRLRRLKILLMDKTTPADEKDKAAIINEFATFRAIANYHLNYFIGKPPSLEELKKYDVVVFDDVDSDDFSKEELQRVKEFYNSGGAIVMIGGWASFGGDGSYRMFSDTGIGYHPGYKNTPIEDILPVKIFPRPDGSGKEPKFKATNPHHPVMKDIPWETIPTNYTYNKVEPKDEAEVLAVDADTGKPLIVVGKRQLIFTGADSHGRNMIWWNPLKWQPWENFVLQGLDYITKDIKTEELEKTVIAKANLPDLAATGADMKAMVSLVNLGERDNNVILKTAVLSFSLKEYVVEKEMGSYTMKPHEVKEVNFSLSIPANLSDEKYEVELNVKDNSTGRILDTLSREISIKKFPNIEFALKPPYYEGGNFDCPITIKNTLNSREIKANLKVELIKDGKAYELGQQEVLLNPEETKEIQPVLSTKGIGQGRYDLAVALYDGQGVLIAQARKGLRIYPVPTNGTEYDFNWVRLVWSRGDDMVFNPRWEELDFFKLGHGPVILLGILGNIGPVVNPPGGNLKGMSLEADVVPQLKKCVEQRIPFYVSILSSWSMNAEPYEIIMDRARAVVRWAEEIGKEYFLGVMLHESDGFLTAPVAILANAHTRLDKANAYVKFIKKVREDLKLPLGKTFLMVTAFIDSSGLYYEAGADARLMETPEGVIGSFPIELSQMRGESRSFNKRWGVSMRPDNITLEHLIGVFHYNTTTGRYDPEMKKDEPRKWNWSLQDMYKMYIEKYYNGVNYLEEGYEFPLKSGKLVEDGRMMKKYLDFVGNNPRCKEVVSKVAVVRSKGDYWGGLAGWSSKDEPIIKADYYHAFGLSWWMKPGKGLPFKEEADFVYLSTFFPNLTDDAVLAKSFWTGTPYGAVDIIYPAMKLSDMKKYNSIIFLGYNRMDSVRGDFLDDLTKYVEEGGTVLLSADQLKNSDDKFPKENLAGVLGAELTEEKINLKGPISVVDGAPLKFKKSTYDVTAPLSLYQEKEPWVYKVKTGGARIAAKDSQDNPVLLLNKYKKGYVILLTSATFSMIPPTGKNEFIRDLIDEVASYQGLPVSLTPADENIEFLISKSGENEATIFLMNHGEKTWKGDIKVDLSNAGLSSGAWKVITAKVGKGYNTIIEINPETQKDKNIITIKGVELQGDRDDFISYRQASFAVIRLGSGL